MVTDMTILMVQQSDQYVFILKHSNHLARDVDTASSQPEGIVSRKIDDGESVVQLCRRQLGQQPIRELLQVLFLRILDDGEVFFDARRNNVAQPFFLLLREHVRLIHHRRKCGHGACSAGTSRVAALRFSRESAAGQKRAKHNQKIEMSTTSHKKSIRGEERRSANSLAELPD